MAERKEKTDRGSMGETDRQTDKEAVHVHLEFVADRDGER